MAQADLRRVARAARAVDAARDELTQAIVAARASGETLRDIAAFAGISYQRVDQILKAQPPAEPD